MTDTPLKPRYEAFCRAYADHPNGAQAARAAGYAPDAAAQQAYKLLARGDVSERIAELQADRAAEREAFAQALIAKLDPIYAAALDDGDRDCVLQVVELQARIAGLVSGGATIRPRGQRSVPTGGMSHEDWLDHLR